MPNWQERADSAKQQADRVKQQEDASRAAEDARAQAEAQRIRGENFQEVTRAMEQLQELGVENMLREINRDARFWGGRGVVSVEPLQANEYQGKYVICLVGEIPDVRETTEMVTVHKFGLHEISLGGSHGGDDIPGGSWTEKRIGFYKVYGSKVLGYEHCITGPKVIVEMEYLRGEDPEVILSRRRNIDHYYGICSRDLDIGVIFENKSFEKTYSSKGPLLSIAEARTFFNEAFLDMIQKREGQPSLPQLQKTAKDGLSRKIADITRRIGKVTEN